MLKKTVTVTVVLLYKTGELDPMSILKMGGGGLYNEITIFFAHEEEKLVCLP